MQMDSATRDRVEFNGGRDSALRRFGGLGRVASAIVAVATSASAGVVIASARLLEPPPGPVPCEQTLPARYFPVGPAPSASSPPTWRVVTQQGQIVRGATSSPGEYFEWVAPPNATSACWQGSWAPMYVWPPNLSIGDGHYHRYTPVGQAANLGLLGAWVPPSHFSRSGTLGGSSEALLPAGMAQAPTGWQDHDRPTLFGTVDLFSGTPLIQVNDLELPIGDGVFRLTRTRSSLHGSTFSTVGSDGNKYAFFATDRVFDWVGEGWMAGEAPVLLIDDKRPDVVGSRPPTTWLILDAHRSIPFVWDHYTQRYEAPPRFRAKLTFTQTLRPSEQNPAVMIPDTGHWGAFDPLLEQQIQLTSPDEPLLIPKDRWDFTRGWIKPPVEWKVELYDGALVYTFVTIWDDNIPNRWNAQYIRGNTEAQWIDYNPATGRPTLHDRPLLSEYFYPSDPQTQARDLRPGGARLPAWVPGLNPGLGAPNYAILRRIEDKRAGYRVDVHHATVQQRALDPNLPTASDCVPCFQECLNKGQISFVELSKPTSAGGREVVWTLVYSHRHFMRVVEPHQMDVAGSEGVPFRDSAQSPFYRWDTAFAMNRTAQGHSAMERIFAYKGSLPNDVRSALLERPLVTEPYVEESVDSADDRSVIERPLRARWPHLAFALQNWVHAIRYDYNQGKVVLPEDVNWRMALMVPPEPPPAGLPALLPTVQFDAPTGPPLLVMTSVFERKQRVGQVTTELTSRRVFVHSVSPGAPSERAHFGLADVYAAGRSFYSAGDRGHIRWLAAIYEGDSLANVLMKTPWLTLAELAYQRHIKAPHDNQYGDEGRYFTGDQQSRLLSMASMSLNPSATSVPSASGDQPNNLPTWRAPLKQWFWDSSANGRAYVVTGLPNQGEPGPALESGVDPLAWWDGHWATVGEISTTQGTRQHVRIHRFIRSPANQLPFQWGTARNQFFGTRVGNGHTSGSPPHPSLLVHPFSWHGYAPLPSSVFRRGASPGPVTVAEALITSRPPDGEELRTPRVIVVVDEFPTRELMMRGEGLPPEQAAEFAYLPPDKGAIKDGQTARTVYELNPWGYVLRKRRWEFRDGDATFQSEGIGEEYIRQTVQSAVSGDLGSMPDSMKQELILTERRSIGFAVAETQNVEAAQGLIEFYEHRIAAPTGADTDQITQQLDAFPWTTRLHRSAAGVKQGLNGTPYFTHQWFYDQVRPNLLIAAVRFNTPTTALLSSPPPRPDPASAAPGQDLLDKRVSWFEHRFRDFHQQSPRHNQPTEFSWAIEPPLQQRPDGAWYFPVSITRNDESGRPSWVGRGLLRDPVNFAASQNDPDASLTWTFREFDGMGRNLLRVEDVAVLNGNVVVPIPRLPHGDTCGIGDSLSISLDTSVLQPIGGIRLSRTQPLNHVYMTLRDRFGEVTDEIEPGQRFSVRQFTRVTGGTEERPTYTSWEYQFAGLHEPEPDSNGLLRFRAGAEGRIRRFNGPLPEGTPVEDLQVRFLDRVPLCLTSELPPSSYEQISEIRWVLDSTGRPQREDNWAVYTDGSGTPVVRQFGGQEVLDIGEVLRVWKFGDNAQAWTRNYLGHRLRRYEGTRYYLWDNEQRGPLEPGSQNVPIPHRHELSSSLDGYDMILKERTTFGIGIHDIWQPAIERRYVRDPHWAHTVVSDGRGGYHNPPPALPIVGGREIDPDAHETVHEYDWRMRRVKSTEYEAAPPGLQPGALPPGYAPTPVRRTLRYFDYAGREVLSVEYGPLMADLGADDPTLLGPDSPVPPVSAFLTRSPRPVSIIQRRFDAGDRVVELRAIDVSAPSATAGQEPSLRTFSYYGAGGRPVFTQSPGAPAQTTLHDALGRPVELASIVRSGGGAGPWSRELERTDLVYDQLGRVVEEHRHERVRDTGDRLDPNNSVRSTLWRWHDFEGKVRAEADLGAQTAAGAAGDTYVSSALTRPRPALAVDPLQPASTLSPNWQQNVQWAVTWPAGVPAWARLSLTAYDSSGRVIATATAAGPPGAAADGPPSTVHSTVTAMRYEGPLLRGVQHNASADPVSDAASRRSERLGYVDGRMVRRTTLGVGGEAPTTGPSESSVSSHHGAAVLDDSFRLVSMTRQQPRFLGREVPGSHPTDPALWEYELSYDFFDRPVQRVGKDGTAFRYTYGPANELRTIEVGRISGPLSSQVFTPGYPPPPLGMIAAADRIGFVEFRQNWHVVTATSGQNYGAVGSVYRTIDIIARAARCAPGQVSCSQPSGRIISHVRQHFNARGHLVSEAQALGGSPVVDTPTVRYEWLFTPSTPGETGSSRLASITYPAFPGLPARVVTHSTGTPGTTDFQLARTNRVTTRIGNQPETALATFAYAGVDRPVEWTLGAAAVGMSLRGPATGPAALVGLDAFGLPKQVLAHRLANPNAPPSSSPPAGDVLLSFALRYDNLGRLLSSKLGFGNAENNTRSAGHRYDGLGRLIASDLGAISDNAADPRSWSLTNPTGATRRDRFFLDHNDNWNRTDPQNTLRGGRVSFHNADFFGTPWALPNADPAFEWGHLRAEHSPSSDLGLLRVGAEGSTDPPATAVQRDGLGRVTFDGRYFFGYDAFGRLAQVNARAGTPTAPTPGHLVRQFVYDGLGRLVRVQRQTADWVEDPTAVSSEHFFYDGTLRIAEVMTAPVSIGQAFANIAGPSGGPSQEAGPGTSQQTANTQSEAIQLGNLDNLDNNGGNNGAPPPPAALNAGTTPVIFAHARLSREYVYDPVGLMPGAPSTDRLLAYFGGGSFVDNSRDRALWVLPTTTGDPVLILDKPTPTAAARPLWRGVFEPYGSVAWAQSLAPETSFVPLRMGHKGLFVERLDRGPVSWDDPLGTTGTAEHEVRLDPLADSLVLVRNRALLPRLGRFLQPDPHATGTPVQMSLASFGIVKPEPSTHASLAAWTLDGTNVAAYLGSDPVNRSDPTGLFFSFTDLLSGGPLMDEIVEYYDDLLQTGMSARDRARDMLTDYGAGQYDAADRILNWMDDEPGMVLTAGGFRPSAGGPGARDSERSLTRTGGEDSHYAMSLYRNPMKGGTVVWVGVVKRAADVSDATLRLMRKQFKTIQRKYWRQHGLEVLQKYGIDTPSNRKLIRAGKAPLDGLGRPLHLHHIQPLATGGPNDIDNLVPVTEFMHQQIHKKIRPW